MPKRARDFSLNCSLGIWGTELVYGEAYSARLLSWECTWDGIQPEDPRRRRRRWMAWWEYDGVSDEVRLVEVGGGREGYIRVLFDR